MTHLHPSLQHPSAVLALITQAPSAGLTPLGGVSQKLRAAQACRIPAYLPQAHHPSAGGLWAAAARWGAWIQPAVPWGSPPPTL